MQAWLQRWLQLLGIVLFVQTTAVTAQPSVSFFYSDIPPYEYTNSQGQAAGIAIERVQQLFHAAGWQVIFHFDSVPRGERALEQLVDFTTVVAPTAQQRQQYVISELPLYQIELGVIRTEHSPPVTQWADLLHQPYLVLRDTRFTYLQGDAHWSQLLALRYEVSNTTDALRLLNSDRFAYFLSYVSSGDAAPAPWLQVDVLGRYPVYLAVSKQHLQAQQFMQNIDVLLRRTDFH